MASGYSTIALKSDGTVWAWGDNYYGILGNGTTVRQLAPVQITALSNIVAIAARGGHALAVTGGGSLYSWGENGAGQVGDGSTTMRTLPVLLTALTNVVEVSAGNFHSLAKTDTGAVYAWGSNGMGQLGDGTWFAKTSPTLIPSPGEARWLTAGALVSHVTLLEGTVKGWGTNYSGEVGDGTTIVRLSPVTVQTPPLVMLLESGQSHSVAVTDDGEVWAWGGNNYGQLGDGTTATRLAPVQIAEAGYNWLVAVPTFSAAGGTYSNTLNVVVTSATPGATIHYTLDGAEPTTSDPTIASGASLQIGQALTLKARAWKAGHPPSVTASAAYMFAAANPTFSPWPSTYSTAQTVSVATQTSGATIHYTLDGSTPTAGSAVYTGPFSIGTTTTIRAVAFKGDWNPSATVAGQYTMNFGTLAAPTITPAAGAYDGQVQVVISADPAATIRYTTDGSWVTASSPVYTGPLTIAATSTIGAKAFRQDYTASSQSSAGYTITVQPPVLTPSAGTYPAGQVISVTSPTQGAVVRYTIDGTAPTSTSPIVPAAGVVAGDFTLRAIATKPGATSSPVVTGAYQVSGALGAARIAAGDMHSLAVRRDGVAWAWGYNGWGQLGDNTTTQRNLPVMSGGLSGILSAGTGDSHSLAIRSDGTVMGWGSNSAGQVGDGSTTTRHQPVSVHGLSQAVAVDGGASHSVALRDDGTVWGWGRNAEGQLGDGSTTQRLAPVQVSALANVTGIGAGYAHSLALKSDGTVWSWGTNGNGQLGLGDSVGRTVPTHVVGAGVAIAVSAGAYHSVALLSDGTVRTWGQNASGQLGDGSTTQRTAPVIVPGLTNVTAIAAGTQHTLALASDGTLWAWGQNQNGQVGDGSGVQRNSAVAIQGLPPIAAIAAGGQHSLAIAVDGSIWAWGRNYFGAVGDGTTTNRLSPVQIADADMNWSVPAPIVSVPSGTYATTQTVTVTSQSSGAALHFTTDGSDPNQSSATIASGSSVPVNASLTLKVRAYAPGAAASGIVVGTYVLRPALPSFTPGAGTYTSAQNVTIETATPETTIRYTLDGSLPTEGSPLYTAPVVVDSTTTLNAVAFRAGWAPSNIASATYTLNFGTLSAPSISPASGLYEYGQSVTMTAEPGAEVRYTTNGSTPSAGSTLYTGPITLQGPGTITAKAFRQNWTPSPATANDYTVRASAPVFSPGPGTYQPSQAITMMSATPGVTLHYTTTGADPTLSDAAVANGGTIPMGTFTLKARAFHGSMVTSDVTAAEYVMEGCSISVSPAAITRSASAGGGIISVSAAGTSCGWTASSDAAWLVPGVTSGDGAGFVSYTLAPNQTGAARSAVVTVAGEAVTVTQDAAPTCTFQVNPLSVAAPATGASGNIAITTSDPQCWWAATADADWVALGAPVSPGPYAAAVLADQPSGYWRLNETAGTVANDSTPHARHGAFAGAVTRGITSALGDTTKAVTFDGGTGVVEIPHHASFNTPSASWEAWIRVDATSAQTRRILGRGADAFSVAIDGGDTRPTIAWRLADTGMVQTTLQTPIVGAGWKHVAFTYDGVTWRAYVDGVEDSTGTLSGALAADTGAITFGRSVTSDQWFDGSLDEVAVYAYALSAQQVAHHFAKRTGIASGSAPLVYSIAANTVAVPRTATLTIADVGVGISQSADGMSAPPTITALLTPPANSAGWHNGPVVVRFVCQDDEAVAFCSPEVTVSTEGENLSVTGIARDSDGTETTVVVPLKIDQTGPAIALVSPDQNESSGAASLVVRFMASDALAGTDASQVRCNGQQADVLEAAFQCSVALQPGTNLIRLTALDFAGNSSGMIVTHTYDVAATRLIVSPAGVGLIVSESRQLSTFDDVGRAVAAMWSSSDESIATVQANGAVATVQALAAGTTTLTASSQGLTATVTVTVYPTVLDAAGTVKWSVPTQTPETFGRLIALERTSADDPDFVGVEMGEGRTILVGLDANGVQMWTKTVAGSYSTVMAASGGGMLLGSAEGGLTRIALKDGEPSWNVNIQGQVAVGPDGTIFAIVHHSREQKGVAVIDGATGAVLARQWLPMGARTTSGPNCEPQGTLIGLTDPKMERLVVGADGAAYLPFAVYDYDSNFCAWIGTTEVEAFVLRITPDGTSQQSAIATHGTAFLMSGSEPRIQLSDPVATGDGAVVLGVRRTNGAQTVWRGLATVSESGATVMASDETLTPLASGDLGLLFVHSEAGGVSARNQSGEQWSLAMAASPAAATAGGGAVLRDAQGTLHTVSSEGELTGQQAMPGSNGMGLIHWVGDTWLQSDGLDYRAVRGPMVEESPFEFLSQRGNAQRQSAPVKPVSVQFVVNPVPHPYPYGPDIEMLGWDDDPNRNDPHTPAEAERDLRLSASLMEISFVSGPAATADRFIKELGKRIGAVAFFGHSYLETYPEADGIQQSMGIALADDWILKDTEVLYEPRLGKGIREETTIRSSAKVILVGSCLVGPVLKDLFGIDEQTKGRALIVPKAGTGGVSPLTDLGHASYAWRVILNMMQSTDRTLNTVGQAVSAANDALQREGKTLRLVVIGDENTRLR